MTREEAISRQAVLDLVVANHTKLNGLNVVMYAPFYKDITQLPPATSQQRTGRWIESMGHDDIDHFYICSECGRYIKLICGAKLADYPYCHCGAKMEVKADD